MASTEIDFWDLQTSVNVEGSRGKSFGVKLDFKVRMLEEHSRIKHSSF